ncbi:DUF1960-domain-containing protein [Basidiobolus meristosporus CBS 931.73]|uniref:DUF1960-domain-containing protein n=1 Tax=Basidiobolus meristosporus CBS 931.73 TaxID=1314790 RepID=A0A1Y1XY94_9FUNG|nr:DUF1960-domain-containing protein [Basidiobolus meristosporus CBS 931.73]|eukprot:ORX90711.1 DUF1960-domain-containing protein [Basidiobolus meristosporus CBS 931.73]
MAASQQIVFTDKEKSDLEFIVYINPDVYSKWKSDKSIPITEVVQSFNVYTTRGGGNTGVAETPSNQELDNVFGTSNDTAVVEHILKHGVLKGSGDISKSGQEFNRSRGSGAGTSDANGYIKSRTRLFSDSTIGVLLGGSSLRAPPSAMGQTFPVDGC